MKKEIILFCKEPILGKVKSRLAKSLGDEKTLQIYTQLLRHTLKVILSSGYRYSIFLAEPLKTDFFSKHSSNIFIQEGKTFEDRLFNALQLRLHHSDHVVVIGSDCPEIKVEHLQIANEYLNDFDMVIGPALDGGFYLLGTKSISPLIFNNIVWSTEAVCLQLIQNAQLADLKIRELECLTDIDTYDDLLNSKFLFE
jgi:uncharacterized protein